MKRRIIGALMMATAASGFFGAITYLLGPTEALKFFGGVAFLLVVCVLGVVGSVLLLGERTK